MQPSKCPSQEELQRILDGSLDVARQDQCLAHFDECAGCQAKLEALATEGTNLSQVIEHLHDSQPLKTSAYWPALQAAAGATGLAQTVVGHTTVRTKDVSLAFLQPATDAAYLGRIAHFDVMRVLGRGGMGVVLEAFDSHLQRNVALKVLDPELADDDTAKQRFCREARAAASIAHENVVAVHQVVKQDGQLPFLVMQLISGETLEQRIARAKKLPVRDIIRISMQAARGLAAAHAQGLVHRDIKPGNILLEAPYDRVKLTDFGLARIVDDLKLTRTGYVSGTPLYMAPEQALGEQTDPRSDLWGLGAIMYEMTTGQTPFRGDSALIVLRQITETKHRPLREVEPTAPQWLAEMIDELLAKRPEDRYQRATDVAEVLEYIWTQMQASSSELPGVCQIELAARRRRTRWTIAGVGAGLLALGLAAGAFLPGWGSAPAVTDTPAAVLSAEAGTVWSVAFDPQSQTLVMGVEDGAVRLWDLQTNNIQATLEAHRGVVWSSQFSHDGAYLATAGDDGLLKLWKTGEAEPFRVYQHPNAVRGLALAHDGRRLYAGDRQGTLRVWSTEQDEPLKSASQPGAIYSVALSADGTSIATAGSDKVIRLWNAETLTPKLPLAGHSGPVNGLAFDATGARLASAGWDKIVRIWDTNSGKIIKSWQGHPGDIWAITFSPTGKTLATAGQEGVVKIWNAETGDLLKTFAGHNATIHALAFNDDGSSLASGGRDGAARIWKIP